MPTRRQFINNLAAVGVVDGATSAVTAPAAPQRAVGEEDNDASRYEKYRTLQVSLNGPVATIMIPNTGSLPRPGERRPNQHWELGEILSEMRG